MTTLLLTLAIGGLVSVAPPIAIIYWAVRKEEWSPAELKPCEWYRAGDEIRDTDGKVIAWPCRGPDGEIKEISAIKGRDA